MKRKNGRGWSLNEKPWAVNRIYYNGNRPSDDELDAWVLLWKQTGDERHREACFDLMHDRVVSKVVGENYDRVDCAYRLFHDGVVDVAMMKWEPSQGHFFTWLMMKSVQRLRADDIRELRREALYYEHMPLLLCNTMGSSSYDQRTECDNSLLLDAMSIMEMREQVILCMLFGINCDQFSQVHIARIMGVSAPYIHKLKKQMLAKLRRLVCLEE